MPEASSASGRAAHHRAAMAGLMAASAPSSGRAARLTCLCERPRFAVRTTSCLHLLSLSSRRSGARVWGCCSPTLACRMSVGVNLLLADGEKMPLTPAPGGAAAAAATAELPLCLEQRRLQPDRTPATQPLSPACHWPPAAQPRVWSGCAAAFIHMHALTCLTCGGAGQGQAGSIGTESSPAALASATAIELHGIGTLAREPAPRPLPSVS